MKTQINKLQLKLNSQKFIIKKQKKNIFDLKLQINELKAKNTELSEINFNKNLGHPHEKDIILEYRTKDIGNVAAIFSHEINQPLAVISTYIRGCIIRLKNSDDGKITCDKLIFPLEQISKQSEQAVKIIDNMLRFMNKLSLITENTDINVLIKETLATLSDETIDLKFKITLNLMNNLPMILTNKTHIVQIISNLVRNSIDSLKNIGQINPELIINTQELNGYIVIHVIDNGPGIPIELQEKIFDTQFSTKSHGIGIGLSICRSLTEAHGGVISIHNNQQQGACFTFTLPIKI